MREKKSRSCGQFSTRLLSVFRGCLICVCINCSEFTWASREWTTATHMGPYIIICTLQEAAQGDVCCNWQSGLRGETGEDKGLYDTYLQRIYVCVLDSYIIQYHTKKWYLLDSYACVFTKHNAAFLRFLVGTFRVQWCTTDHAEREQVNPPLSWGATSTNGPAWRSSRQLNKRSPLGKGNNRKHMKTL